MDSKSITQAKLFIGIDMHKRSWKVHGSSDLFACPETPCCGLAPPAFRVRHRPARGLCHPRRVGRSQAFFFRQTSCSLCRIDSRHSSKWRETAIPGYDTQGASPHEKLFCGGCLAGRSQRSRHAGVLPEAQRQRPQTHHCESSPQAAQPNPGSDQKQYTLRMRGAGIMK